MNLLPRFYYRVDKEKFNDLKVLKEKENTGYITIGSNVIKHMYVLKNKTSKGKFLSIEGNIYYRPKEYRAFKYILDYICSKCYGPDSDMRFIFKTPTKDLDKKYNYHNDLYYLFYDFFSFEKWYHSNNIEILQLMSAYHTKNIDSCKSLIFTGIKDHFDTTAGNIFLLKIKFDENDMSDFYGVI